MSEFEIKVKTACGSSVTAMIKFPSTDICSILISDQSGKWDRHNMSCVVAEMPVEEAKKLVSFLGNHLRVLSCSHCPPNQCD